jgi:uncharacterized protein YndB with AHSA1/START domain
MSNGKSNFVYVTYIRTPPEKLWEALTTPAFMKQYWFGMVGESQWTAGSAWQLVTAEGQIVDAGKIIAAQPPRRLVIDWQHQKRPEIRAEGVSRCTMELEPLGAAVKLTIMHGIERDDSKFIEAVSGGWPKIISNLESLLETGTVVRQEPYPAEGAWCRDAAAGRNLRHRPQARQPTKSDLVYSEVRHEYVPTIVYCRRGLHCLCTHCADGPRRRSSDRRRHTRAHEWPDGTHTRSGQGRAGRIGQRRAPGSA